MTGSETTVAAVETIHPRVPTPGSFVRVRQRRWLVERCEPFDTITSLELACVEDDAQGERLAVLWEAEPDARILHDTRATHRPRRPDPPERFAAYLHALRWSCVTSTDPTLFQAPLRAGIIPKTYQLEPLRKALALPRVNLFIADDVGLGKTIEAGLILHELLLRQRIHRAVIAAPPSVTLQWRDELRQRFGLDFALYDRDFILACRRARGFGVNPWKTRSFFVVSHALLRDEEHLAGLRDALGDFASGSMLVLDEAHVAAPASASRYAVDTQITRAVRDLAQRFEHRLFLSATPHNGHSNSFSALMHILDPQRFTRGIDIRGPAQLAPVMVRRLKADVRRHASASLPERKLVEVALHETPDEAHELRLAALLARYDDALSARSADADLKTQGRVRIAIEALRKRLLSSVYAFQRTLRAHRKETAHTILDGLAPAETDPDDDEAEAPSLVRLDAETARDAQRLAPFTDDSIRALLAEMAALAEATADQPDARVRSLVAWVRQHQCPGLAPLGSPNTPGTPWLPRRVLIFTEFADTRAWLVDQLRGAIEGTHLDDQRIGSLHGSQDEDEREALKLAFNTPPEKHPLRILVATDAAREGINLQAACADLFHFDLPWNPARIEQRNGRIDRMLQPSPEVRCHYFRYKHLPEDAVLARLATKSHAIASELGSFAPVVSERILAVLARGLSRRQLAQRIAELDEATAESPDDPRAVIRRELDEARDTQLVQSLNTLEKLHDKARSHLACDPQRLQQVVSEGLKLSGGEGLSPQPDHTFVVPRMDTRHPNDPTWRAAIDALRPPRPPKMSEGEWRATTAPRPVILHPIDTLVSEAVQLHLQHPLAQRAVSPFRAQAFTEEGLARVTVVVDRSSTRKRVLVLGRLAVFGHGAARLHEEVLGLAAYWSEGDDPQRLEPFATEEANTRALEAFFQVLDAPEVPQLAPHLVERLLRSAPADQRALEAHLRRRAMVRTEVARTRLQARGRAEAEAMRAVLEAQRDDIVKALQGTQLALGIDDREALSDLQKQQWKDDRAFLARRLPQVEHELATEPARIQSLYEDRQHHVEMVGIVYLWPATS
jgi:hypothetical protein